MEAPQPRSVSELKYSNLKKLPPKDETASEKPERQKFKSYEIGFSHIDICKSRTSKSNGYIYIAGDRVCKFIYVQMKTSQTILAAVDFLKDLTKRKPITLSKKQLPKSSLLRGGAFVSMILSIGG